MNFKSIFDHKNILIIPPTIIISSLIINPKSATANECPYSNFMVVDGKCINLDPQMKTKKKSSAPQGFDSLSDLDELTGSSMATYASLLSLVGGSVAGYKFLVRK